MGDKAANVIFDTWVHPLMMGLEEHLLGLFKDDFEFGDGAAPSHLGHGPARAPETETYAQPAPPSAPALITAPIVPVADPDMTTPQPTTWSAEAEAELKKIPFFVRGKARRNTEAFAKQKQLPLITLETLYDAKAHFGR